MIQHTILEKPDFAMLNVQLEAGQKINAEPSAMISMDSNIKMKSSLKGGLGKSLMRGLGGESFVMNTFTAEGKGGEVQFAPGPMGDMEHYHLDGGNNIMLQRGAYVASEESVQVDGKWAGFKGFFSGEGLVLLKCSGEGDLFFNTYGSILSVDVTDNYVVDTNYVVAFEDSLDYSVEPIGGLKFNRKGLKSLFLSGEGLVCKFRGQGKLWIQTRAVGPFLGFIWPFRPVKNNN